MKNEDAQRLAESANDDDTEAEVCTKCFGTGVEVVPGKGARPCSCRGHDPSRALVDAARIPKRYGKKCTLENFRPTNESQRAALGLARSFVSGFFRTDGSLLDGGLLFMGPVGVGKTHLAVGILHELLKQGVGCLFLELGSLLKKIQDSYNPISMTSESRVLEPVYEAELLVLDELGASIPTDWVRDTLYQIINTRYNDRKLTIFTTNFRDERPESVELDEAETHTRAGKAKFDRRGKVNLTPTLEERIGVPLRSRLYEMCTKVEMSGKDYRKREI